MINQIDNSINKLDINLTVILTEEVGCWVAQSLEVYYVAYGRTLEDAKSNFEKGFIRTIEENQKRFGNIDKFINTKAPDDTWREFEEFKRNFTKSIKVIDEHPNIPVMKLDYMNLKAA